VGDPVKNEDIRVVAGIETVSSLGIATSACNTRPTPNASYACQHHSTSGTVSAEAEEWVRRGEKFMTSSKPILFLKIRVSWSARYVLPFQEKCGMRTPSEAVGVYVCTRSK
jgi:hypothetical protein